MRSNILTFLLVSICCFMGCTPKTERHGNYVIKDQTIVFDEPQRSEGQQSVLQLAVAPIPNVRIGFVGLGMRGHDAVDRISYIDGISIVALCDIEQDRVEAVQSNILDSNGLPRAAEYVGREAYQQFCKRDDIDLVYICTDWKTHVPIAVYAMQHGKPALCL